MNPYSCSGNLTRKYCLFRSVSRTKRKSEEIKRVIYQLWMGKPSYFSNTHFECRLSVDYPRRVKSKDYSNASF